MFWAGHDHDFYETRIRQDLVDIFEEYHELQQVIGTQDHGIAAASHLANRIRTADREALRTCDLGEEMNGMVAQLDRSSFISHQSCLVPLQEEYDSTTYLFTSKSRAPDDPHHRICQALDLISRTSFAPVRSRIGKMAVVTLGEQQFPNTNQSYTLKNIFMTIYLDLYESPVLVAESIVHEHAHMTFNNYVYAEKVYDDPTPIYYSPWKECLRPAFNFLHSLIAFSDVIKFIQEVAAFDLNETDRKYVDMKLRFERRNLASVQKSANEALSLLPDRKIAERIAESLAAVQ